MPLISRTSRFFGQPSPGRTFADVARELDLVVKRNTQRTKDVVLASYSIGCDGRPMVSLLDGSPCDGDGRIGLATRDRALLTGVLPRPMQSNNAGTGALAVTRVDEGGATSGRFFADTSNVVYEGRNGLYHAGYSPQPNPNGTIVETVAAGATLSAITGDVRSDWDTHWSGDVFHHDEEYYNGSTWVEYDPRITDLPAYSDFTPHFCFASTIDLNSLDPLGDLSDLDPITTSFPVQAETSVMRYRWIGRCSLSTPGYRDSSTLVGGIEGHWQYDGTLRTGWLAIDQMRIALVFRDPTTFAVLGYAHLDAVEQYAKANHSDRTVTAYGDMGWRAGVQVRPVEDGTWVVSIFNSDRAWVYEALIDEETGAVTPSLLETVTFPTDYTGVIRAFYA